MVTKASVRRDMYGDPGIPDLEPIPGYEYFIARNLKINILDITNKLNQCLGKGNFTNVDELVSSFIFDALLLFHYDILEPKKDSKNPGMLLLDGGKKESEVELTIDYPKFLGKRLQDLSTYGSIWRQPKTEHMFFKLALLYNLREGQNHCLKLLNNFREFKQYLKEDGIKEKPGGRK